MFFFLKYDKILNAIASNYLFMVLCLRHMTFVYVFIWKLCRERLNVMRNNYCVKNMA